MKPEREAGMLVEPGKIVPLPELDDVMLTEHKHGLLWAVHEAYERGRRAGAEAQREPALRFGCQHCKCECKDCDCCGEVGHFDICKEMAKRGMDIRMSLLENVTNLRYSNRNKGTTVSIGVDGKVVTPIFQGKFVGGLLLCDKEQYFSVKRELEETRQKENP